MSMRYQLVIFDWEGTLSDTLGEVLDCIETEAKKLNLGEFNVEAARQSIELGLFNVIKKSYPRLNTSQFDQLFDAVQQSLLIRPANVHLMQGALDLIQKLSEQGVTLAIASNKGQQSLSRAIQMAGLKDYFKITRTATECAPKPSSQMLEQILELADISVEQAVMIGDSTTDMETAHNLKMDAIGMSFYGQTDDILLNAGALKVFNSYQDLTAYLG